jgi:hypothetical protein
MRWPSVILGVVLASTQVLAQSGGDTVRRVDSRPEWPGWGGPNRNFMVASTGLTLELSRAGSSTNVKELWYSNTLRVHCGNVLRIGDHDIGSSGDVGPAFLTALDARTGAVAWQDRSFAKANFLSADGKVILVGEDGTLGLLTIAADRMTVLAHAPVGPATACSAPTLVGTTLYLRDRATIMAIDLGGKS